MTGEVKIEAISGPMKLGEGPHWIEEDSSLVFVDFPSGCVNRYYTKTKRLQVLDFDNIGDDGPSFIIPVKDSKNLFAIGIGHYMCIVQWSSTDPDRCSKKVSKVCSFDLNCPTNRLNDAKVDPQGRLWTGTAGHETATSLDLNKATLFRVDSDLSTTEWVKGVSISNGMAWNQQKDTFYYIDSPPQTVEAFDYDNHTGDIKNRRLVLNLEKAGLTGHFPDGMTIDNHGNLWVACYAGAKVICIDPNVGQIIRTVDTPSLYTTSCCFGGADYSTLYVTSATRLLSEEEIALRPDSGKTFAITGLGVRGFAPQSFEPDLNLLAKALAIA